MLHSRCVGFSVPGIVVGYRAYNTAYNMAPSPHHLWCNVCLLGVLFGGGSPAGAPPAATPLDTVLPEAVQPGAIAALGRGALLFASPTTRVPIRPVLVPVIGNVQGPFP